MSQGRYLCIHGHFYQPPRENPWLEAIELQESAHPFHDWNERINAECYATNGAARILNAQHQISKIVNNYAQMSFNFGPTLLQWMEKFEPETYARILAADRESMDRFSGHGSAMAQVYNHIIMPLANRRDKETQIIWGIRDFEARFGRKPEGMWLAETAVDLETLDILAEHGIKFTVLAPYQAARIRRIKPAKRPLKDATQTKELNLKELNAKDLEPEWYDVLGGRIDPRRVYVQKLASGREIALFFYDGPVSRGIAFEGLLSSGEGFANRLTGLFSDAGEPQIVHIATDGETYGHHHKKGDMALAYALEHIQRNNLATLTNYGEYLEKCPPQWEVQIVENTAWSCAHGIGRWEHDCSCNSGGYPHWNQQWRRPLRDALNWLRDELAMLYEGHASRYFDDPWAVRNAYIEVMLDRSPESIDAFLDRNTMYRLNEDETVHALKLLEMQRHALYMFTSCGWFFDELSGIETVQVIMYAGRAVQLARESTGADVESEFLARLEHAHSNIPEHGSGRRIYEKWVRPAMVDLPKVGAHYALSSLFSAYPDAANIYSYTVERQTYTLLEQGRTRFFVGRARITSQITRESADLTFAGLHFGDHNLSGGVRPFRSNEAYEHLVTEARDAFERADLPEVIRLLDRHFEGLTYSLKTLFRDEQRKILGVILSSTFEAAENVYHQLYENNAPLMRFLTSLNVPMPQGFKTAADIALNSDMRRLIHRDDFDMAQVSALINEANRIGVRLNEAELGFALRQKIDAAAEDLRMNPTHLSTLHRALRFAQLAKSVPFSVDLWRAQNIYWELCNTVLPGMQRKVVSLNGRAENARVWVDQFMDLGRALNIEVSTEQVTA
jgi:alpha-amylase/alpha-mannosidase (GH57 family)